MRPLTFATISVFDNKISKHQLTQKEKGVACLQTNTGQCNVYINGPITTLPTILQIKFRSKSLSEPPLGDRKNIHNKTSCQQ